MRFKRKKEKRRKWIDAFLSNQISKISKASLVVLLVKNRMERRFDRKGSVSETTNDFRGNYLCL